MSPHVADQAEDNDWLFTVAAAIIAAHNAFIEGVYSPQVQEQSPLEWFLPDEPATVSPSEVNDSNCIVGKFERWAFFPLHMEIFTLMFNNSLLALLYSGRLRHGI